MLIRIGAILAILGFGSLILQSMDLELRILSWARDMQPAFGIMVGVIGLGLIGGGIWLNAKGKIARSGGPQHGTAEATTPQPRPGFGQPAQPQYGAPNQQNQPNQLAQPNQPTEHNGPGQPNQGGSAPYPGQQHQQNPGHGDEPIQGPGFGR